MPDSREANGGLLGLLGVGMVVCCGLPLVLGTGIAIGAAGLALGSCLIVAAGITIGVWGGRRHQTAPNCDLPEPGRPAGPPMRAGCWRRVAGRPG